MDATRHRPLKIGLLTPTWENRADGTVTRWTDVRVRFDVVGRSLPLPPSSRRNIRVLGWMVATLGPRQRDKPGRAGSARGLHQLPPSDGAREDRRHHRRNLRWTPDSGNRGRLDRSGVPGPRCPVRPLGEPVRGGPTIIATLLREGEIDFDGQYYQALECELCPRGLRPKGPPIMVGATHDRMIHLAAKQADILNRDFGPTSHADLEARHAQVDTACATVGRAPATLERTVAVAVDLPDSEITVTRDAITGTPEELAESLRGIAASGVTHVQIWLEPSTLAGIETFAPTLELLDRN